MDNKSTRQVVTALLGETGDSKADTPPAELVDALRKRLRAYDALDRDRDRNLLAAYLEGTLDEAGRKALRDRLMTAKDANARVPEVWDRGERIGAAPRAFDTREDEPDIGEELRDARRWTGRLAPAPVPASFAAAAIVMRCKPEAPAKMRRALRGYLRGDGWKATASLVGGVLVIVIGLDLALRDRGLFGPGEDVPPVASATAPDETGVTFGLNRMEPDATASASYESREAISDAPVGTILTAQRSRLLRAFYGDQAMRVVREAARMAERGREAHEAGRFPVAMLYLHGAKTMLQGVIGPGDPLVLKIETLQRAAERSLQEAADPPLPD